MSQPSPISLAHPSPLAPVLPRPGERAFWCNLHGSGRGAAIASAATAHRGPLLLVTATVRGAQQLEDEIRFYLGPAERDIPILAFPDWEVLPYEAFSAHQDIVSQRLLALSRLPGLGRGIVIIAIATLLQRL